MRARDASLRSLDSLAVHTRRGSGHGHASIKRLRYVEGPFAAATIVAVVKAKRETELDTRFLGYFLEAFKDDLLVPLMKGAANVSLTLDNLSSVRVPLPSLAEQRRLMETLVGLDDGIAAARLRVDELVESRLAAMPSFKAALGEVPSG